MQRRKFLKRAGLSTALITTGGVPQLLGGLTGRRNPFTGKPRPESWVFKRHIAMHGILSQGRRTMWSTGYMQPCVRHGWEFVDRFPLDLQLGQRTVLPIPGSLIYIDDFTYAWTEQETVLGPVRVDFLQSRMMDILQAKMKLFDIELCGKPVGSIGYFEGEPDHWKRKPEPLHTNWYGGLRHGDYAFKIEDSMGFGNDAWKGVSLFIWKKKNTGRPVSGVLA